MIKYSTKPTSAILKITSKFVISCMVNIVIFSCKGSRDKGAQGERANNGKRNGEGGEEAAAG
jgi:hypothetical protein